MISDLSQRIEIKRLQVDEDFGFGEPGNTETSILTTVASIREIKRGAAVYQQLSVENINYKLVIRYGAGREIRKDDVIVWRGERYKAIIGGSVVEEDKKRFIEATIVKQDG